MAKGSNPFEPVILCFCGGIHIGFSILDHIMVPEHRVLDDDEIEEILSKYNIEKEKLSKILTSDPVIKEIGANAGDVVEITRKSETTGESKFYRLVIE
ncbi:DNA-directed RNA polymerase subunit H [Methanosarcinales archaeon]|nr:MAG: DNA-directed RNA polymerase subunit H [Methanosarcinales archaeon]